MGFVWTYDANIWVSKGCLFFYVSSAKDIQEFVSWLSGENLKKKKMKKKAKDDHRISWCWIERIEKFESAGFMDVLVIQHEISGIPGKHGPRPHGSHGATFRRSKTRRFASYFTDPGMINGRRFASTLDLGGTQFRKTSIWWNRMMILESFGWWLLLERLVVSQRRVWFADFPKRFSPELSRFQGKDRTKQKIKRSWMLSCQLWVLTSKTFASRHSAFGSFKHFKHQLPWLDFFSKDIQTLPAPKHSEEKAGGWVRFERKRMQTRNGWYN